MLEQGLSCMPIDRLLRPELQKLNDSQPLEWTVSYDLGTMMEKCLYSTPKGKTYVALPGARLPEPGYIQRKQDGGKDAEKRKRGSPPQLDWLFSNGDMPKASLQTGLKYYNLLVSCIMPIKLITLKFF